MALPARADVVQLPERRSPLRAAFVALRPRQWSKNLLLFAGIVFAAKVGDWVRWAEAATAFATFCAGSSAAYLVNDLRDAPHDRLHPLKRLRPVARGELSPRTALLLAAGLVALAVVLVAPLGLTSLAFLAGFLALQGAYSFGLKHVVLIDVLAIATLFVLRSAAGAEAVDVRISPWLLVCTALLALFLALAKRRSELVLTGAARPVLDGYSLPFVDQLITITVACTIAAYSVYTITAHSPALAATIPFVVFGLFRYLLLVQRDDLGEEPENVLLTDRPLIVAVSLWAATAAAILAATS
ncbi:MAG TPA: UbiA prenyltransferase family protein [Gaiellaceae bacterium]|nr:UbiA prenyltransferase family protein [Gaiellaceae bacterium]